MDIRIAFVAALGAMASLAPAGAQTETAPVFEVASIKLNQTTLDGNRSINRAPGGGFEASNVSLSKYS